MRIILYKNRSEPNRVDKTLEEIVVLDGNLREECSIMSPSITIKATANVVTNCNYMWIQDWNRYYFIDDITSIRNDIWSISGSIDVLHTYKEQFKNIPCVISRQENLYNLYLEDSKLVSTVKRSYVMRPFPHRLPNATNRENTSFVLTLAGSTVTE